MVFHMYSYSRLLLCVNCERRKASLKESVSIVKNSASLTLTVIIAALNEEEGIGPTIEELKSALEDPTYLVIDGNSVDRTAEIARKMGAEVVFQEGSGKGQAVAQAIEHVNSDTCYVVFIDADFTYPAKYVPEMIQVLEENPDVGMVVGNRFTEPFDFKHMNSAYYVGNRFLAFAQHLVNGVNLQDPLTGLRVVRWEILKDWKPKSKGFDVEAELNYLVEKKGYKVHEIPIHYRKRLGEKKLKLRHGFTILRRILTESLRES